MSNDFLQTDFMEAVPIVEGEEAENTSLSDLPETDTISANDKQINAVLIGGETFAIADLTARASIGDLSLLQTTAKSNLVAAVNETFTSVSNGKAQVASAITDKGVPTASDATFATMAENIRAIQSTGGAYNIVSTLLASGNQKLSITDASAPSGTISITENGTHNVSQYATADVNVPGIIPTGTISITENGTYDISQYASANVNVSGGSTEIVTVTVRPYASGHQIVFSYINGTTLSTVTVTRSSSVKSFQCNKNSIIYAYCSAMAPQVVMSAPFVRVGSGNNYIAGQANGNLEIFTDIE